MNVIDYKDHKSLIPFYSKRGIEELNDYSSKPIFSYVITEEEKLIGAATCSLVDGYYILEAIAIEEEYTGKKLGSLLLKQVFERLQSMGAKSVIINAKNPNFFGKHGFVETDRRNAPKSEFEYCNGCSEYGVTCFPKIMICEFKNDKKS